MGDRRKDQAERMARYAHLIEQQTGKAVRPFRADGYVNLLNRYGTQQDTTERYRYQAEPMVPDELLTMYYEGNGLFAKIIDTPAEEAIKHGFKLEGLKDQRVEDFFTEALDELDWEETAMTAIRWARLFGGSIAVMLINDGRGLEEPLDWRSIRSIDDIRVYDRSVIQPEEWSMFSYDPQDPFRTRESRLGMPERYHVSSRYGSFVVHDSRCLRERLKGYEATRKTPDDLLRQMATPFENDPFSMVWAAFKNLYPDKECEVFWDQHQKDEHEEEYGFANFPTNGSTPQVFVFAEHPVTVQTETFAHELAHVAVGPEHEHDEVWEAAFDAIFKEYNRLGDLRFAKPEEEETAEGGVSQA